MQRCKYPVKTMNITQSYTGTYSHSKNYNGSPRDYRSTITAALRVEVISMHHLIAVSSVFMELAARGLILYGSSLRHLYRRLALRIM